MESGAEVAWGGEISSDKKGNKFHQAIASAWVAANEREGHRLRMIFCLALGHCVGFSLSLLRKTRSHLEILRIHPKENM